MRNGYVRTVIERHGLIALRLPGLLPYLLNLDLDRYREIPVSGSWQDSAGCPRAVQTNSRLPPCRKVTSRIPGSLYIITFQ
jgi:hypothetical protein